MFSAIIIKDHLGKPVQPVFYVQHSDTTKEQHFAACVYFSLDLLSGGHRLKEEKPDLLSGPTGLPPGQFLPATTLIMFLINLHHHPDCSEDLLCKDNHPYYALWKKLVPLLLRPVTDPSANQEFVNILKDFTAPGISIQIETTQSENEQTLNKCFFPEKLVPKAFFCNITQEVMDKPCYISNAATPIEENALKRHLIAYKKDPLTNLPASEIDIKYLNSLAEDIKLFVNKVEMLHTFLDHKDAVERYELFLPRLTNNKLSRKEMFLILKVDKAKVLYGYGVSLFKEKNYQEALHVFKLVLEAFEYNKKPVQAAGCLYNITSCYMRLFDYENAKKRIEQCLELRQKNLPANDEAIVKAQKKKHDIEGHKLACQKFEEANKLFKTKQYTDALPLYEETIKLHLLDDERLALYHYNTGSCYDRLKNIDKAIQHTGLAYEKRLNLYGEKDASTLKAKNKLARLQQQEEVGLSDTQENVSVSTLHL